MVSWSRTRTSALALRRIHRVSVAAAAIVLVVTVVSIVTKPTPCGSLPSSYSPMIAFELARSGRDLHAIFGGPGACRDAMVSTMDTANHVDLAVFIPAWGVFLVAAFVGLGRRGRPGARPAVALALVAVAMDVVENVCLLGLTPGLDASSGSMRLLPWVTGVKWLALGAVGAAAAAALWPGERRHHRVSAALCLITPIATVAAMVWPHRFGPAIGAGVAISWIMLMIDGYAQARAPLELDQRA